jgi:hypothetical protein
MATDTLFNFENVELDRVVIVVGFSFSYCRRGEDVGELGNVKNEKPRNYLVAVSTIVNYG